MPSAIMKSKSIARRQYDSLTSTTGNGLIFSVCSVGTSRLPPYRKIPIGTEVILIDVHPDLIALAVRATDTKFMDST